MLKRPELPEGFQGKVFKDRVSEGVCAVCDQLVDILLLVGGEVIRNQHHQPSGSNRSGVYVLVGSIQFTSSTWWEFQYLQNSSKDVVPNMIYSP